MKLKQLHEDGHWVPVKNHPGTPPETEKKIKKDRLSFLLANDREKFQKKMGI